MSDLSGLTSLSANTNENVNWADDDSDDNAWGNVGTVNDAPVSMRDLMKEEEKKGSTGQMNQPRDRGDGTYRPPQRGDMGDFESYKREKRQEGRTELPDNPPYTAYLGLSYQVMEEDIYEFFGDLDIENNSVKVIRNRDDGRPKGFGYISFNTREGLSQALLRNGENFFGRPLKVDVSIPKQTSSNRYSSSSERYGSYDNRSGNRNGYGGSETRKSLNIAPRTKPLEDRHLDPTKVEGVQIQTRSQPTIEKKNPPQQKKKVDPFGGASGVDLSQRYLEKQVKVVDRQPTEERTQPRTETNRTDEEPREQQNTVYRAPRGNKKNNNNRPNRPNRPDSDGFSVRGGRNRGGKRVMSRYENNQKKEEVVIDDQPSSNPFDLLVQDE